MIALRAVLGLVVLWPAAANDNNVEWSGVTHVGWQDRRPLCPIDGETSDVLFQTYRFDITSARVHVDDGSVTWVDASYDHDRGPYAVWRATVPATASTSLSYYIELTDGTDTDYLSVSGMSDGTPTDGGFIIDYSTLAHAPYGATMVTGGGTVFRVWAPEPTSAHVRGEFNGWDTSDPMTPLGDDFVVHVPDAGYRDMYKYFFSPGDTWKPDARARSLNPGDNYNSHIEDPFHYAWGDDAFQTPPFEEMVIYELHVGTFSGRNDPVASGSIPGTYADVAAHVGHLVELGINAVELMPITEYPWDFSAGYNPVSQWAPEWKHGDPDDLKAMIDVLHQNGIAVIHDIVWNHFSSTDNYVWLYTRDGGGAANQIYFDGDGITGHIDTPWGSQADFDRAEVRDYYADSSLLWLEEYHLDGFRMDATDFMDSYQGSGWGLMQRFNDEIDARWVDKITIAEQLPDDSWVTRPTAQGGAGFDSQWYDAFVDNLRQEIFDAAVGDPEMGKIANIINGGGTNLENTKVLNYFELHDEAWPDSGGQRVVKTIDTTFPHDDIYAKGRTKLAQGVVMFAPGIPMILQGTEWLEDTDFGSGSPSGTDRIDWSKKTTYANIFQYYKDLIAVRRSNCGMRSDAGHNVFHTDDSGNVIAWSRGDGQELVVVANFSNTNYTNYNIDFPLGGTWYEILDSQASDYDGNGWGNGGSVTAAAGSPHTASMVIPQMGLLVFRHESPLGRSSDLNGDGHTDLYDYYLLQQAAGSSGCGTSADLDEDGRVDADDVEALVSNLTGPV